MTHPRSSQGRRAPARTDSMPRGASSSRGAIVAALAFSLGVLVGNLPSLFGSSRPARASDESPAIAAAVPGATELPSAVPKAIRAIERPYLIRPSDACVPKDQQAEAQYRKEQ